MRGITPSQMRGLHAEARKRGLDHDALRDLAAQGFGVRSLRDLSSDQARRLLERLSAPRDMAPHPSRDREGAVSDPSHKRPPRLPPGCIRMATREQRQALFALLRRLRDLGWTDAKCSGWLRRRHSITDVDRGTYSSAAASAAITELQRVVAAERQRLNPGSAAVPPSEPSRDREGALSSPSVAPWLRGSVASPPPPEAAR